MIVEKLDRGENWYHQELFLPTCFGFPRSYMILMIAFSPRAPARRESSRIEFVIRVLASECIQ
jgi:hypothetical protein